MLEDVGHVHRVEPSNSREQVAYGAFGSWSNSSSLASSPFFLPLVPPPPAIHADFNPLECSGNTLDQVPARPVLPSGAAFPVKPWACLPLPSPLRTFGSSPLPSPSLYRTNRTRGCAGRPPRYAFRVGLVPSKLFFTTCLCVSRQFLLPAKTLCVSLCLHGAKNHIISLASVKYLLHLIKWGNKPLTQACENTQVSACL